MKKYRLILNKDYYLKETKKFYSKFSKNRIKFLRKNQFFYHQISNYLKNIISNKKNLMFFCCGNSLISEKIHAEKLIIHEINSELILDENINDEINENELNLLDIDTIICADIEHQINPQKTLSYLSNKIKDDCEIIIISKSLIWAFLIKFFKFFFRNQFSTEYNFLPFNYIKNLAEINNFEIIKNEKRIIYPKTTPYISNFLNKVFSLPILNFFCMINLTVIKKKNIIKKSFLESKISIIIPCKNEEKNIKIIEENLINLGKETEYIFGDDLSIDKTLEEIKNIKPVDPKIKIKIYQGPGICKSKNVFKGIEESEGEIILIYDADCTISFKDIQQCLTVMSKTNTEFINCTRMIYPQEANAMKKFNFLGNVFFAFLFSYLFNQKITDTLCGTKIFYKKDWLKLKSSISISGKEDLWGDFDLLIGAYKNNIKITEVPVKYYNRIEGETKMTSVFQNGLRMLNIIIKSYIKIRLS